LTTCDGTVILYKSSADGRSRPTNSPIWQIPGKELRSHILNLRDGASEKLTIKVMKKGTANSLVMQSREFAETLNVNSPPVLLHLRAKDLDYALGIGPQKATLSTGCSL
jgi:hypothetical protein